MKKNLLSMVAATLFSSTIVTAQVTESFEPIQGQSISVKSLLEQQNWQFPDFDINPEGAAPISGVQSIASVVPGNLPTQLTGIVTPYLAFSNSETIQFSYKLHRAMMNGCRRWVIIELIDINNNRTQLDSIEVDAAQVTPAIYNKTVSGMAGEYALYANLRGEGCNAKFIVDDVLFTGTLSGNTNKPSLKQESATGIFNANNQALQLTLYPNPASNQINLAFTSEKSEEATIEVYSIDGSKLISLQADVQSGSNQLPVNVSSLVNGNYIVSIKTASGVTAKRFTKVL